MPYYGDVIVGVWRCDRGHTWFPLQLHDLNECAVKVSWLDEFRGWACPNCGDPMSYDEEE